MAGGNLVLHSPGVRDSGRYVCTAVNDLGRVQATVDLTVTGNYFCNILLHFMKTSYGKEIKYFPPISMNLYNFIYLFSAPLSTLTEPYHQTVDMGNTASFNCTVYGHPVDRVSWYKDGEPLQAGGRVEFPTPTRLVVRDVQRIDRGMYQCLAGNEDENSQGSAQLSLGGRIII